MEENMWKIFGTVNMEENTVENMVENIKKVLLAAKNRCSSARNRSPLILPIRSIE